MCNCAKKPVVQRQVVVRRSTNIPKISRPSTGRRIVKRVIR